MEISLRSVTFAGKLEVPGSIFQRIDLSYTHPDGHIEGTLRRDTSSACFTLLIRKGVIAEGSSTINAAARHLCFAQNIAEVPIEQLKAQIIAAASELYGFTMQYVKDQFAQERPVR